MTNHLRIWEKKSQASEKRSTCLFDFGHSLSVQRYLSCCCSSSHYLNSAQQWRGKPGCEWKQSSDDGPVVPLLSQSNPTRGHVSTRTASQNPHIYPPNMAESCVQPCKSPDHTELVNNDWGFSTCWLHVLCLLKRKSDSVKEVQLSMRAVSS